jgi:hypothetical protein
MPVTRHPPHRSQACGTTALGSCLRSNAETLRCFSYPVQSDRRCFQPPCAGHGRLNTVPLGRRPFLHELRRWLAAYLWLCTFVRSLHRYYSSVRLPRRVHVELRPLACPDRAGCGWQPVAPGISRFPYKEFAYMLRVSDSAGPVRRSR